MPIYIDPTESHEGTRLPQSVIKQAVNLPGLEAATGADILVTTKKVEANCINPQAALVIAVLDQEFHTLPQLARLAECSIPEAAAVLSFIQAIQAGILIQRKSGGDLISSIPHLRDTRNRMLLWSYRVWLLMTGDVEVQSGKVVVDDRVTNCTIASFDGARMAWRLDGGHVSHLQSDADIAGWLSDMLDRLRAFLGKDGDDGRAARYKRPIINRDDDRARSLALLATLKGVGDKGAVKLLNYYGSPAAALEAVLDPSIPKSKFRPGGVLGTTTVRANRELFGLKDDEIMIVAHMPEG